MADPAGLPGTPGYLHCSHEAEVFEIDGACSYVGKDKKPVVELFKEFTGVHTEFALLKVAA